MAKSLNTTGLVAEEVMPAKPSRHLTPRKVVGLNFNNEGRPYGTALAYWRDSKAATPLIWYVLDMMAEKGDDLKSFMAEVSGDEFGSQILEELTKNHAAD